MTSTYSTVINFRLKDLLNRMDRIKTINCITNDVSKTFCFPREEKKLSKRSLQKVLTDINLNTVDIAACVNMALNDAISDAKKLGIVMEQNNWIFIDTLLSNLNQGNEDHAKNNSENNEDNDNIDSTVLSGDDDNNEGYLESAYV